jgi:hypothetical protein
MKVLCSYCRTSMGEKAPLDDPSTSHGVCPACFEHYAPQWDGQSTGEYLDRFEAPVVAVDMDVQVVAINRAMARRKGIDNRAAAGMLGGDLLECTHARLPGGCGRTVHCKACAIRGVVTETVRTAEPQHGVPASLDMGTEVVDLQLSTFLREGLVYLLIESTPQPDQG